MRLMVLITLILSGALSHYQNDRFKELRDIMVESQIISRGITDSRTIEAMRKVPRHLFVPPGLRSEAYADYPLSIGHGQTISQPFIVAYMTELSEPSPGKKALEIGTGSGYQAAVLAEIADSVFTIELVPELTKEAETRLRALGYDNIVVREGDGYNGWPGKRDFDIILVTAAAPQVPPPLIEQLAEGGRLVMPVGEPDSVQQLILLTKRKGKVSERRLEAVRFVPLRRGK